MNSGVRMIAAYIALGAVVLVWALAFGGVIDRDIVPFAAVSSLVMGWVAYRAAQLAHEWQGRGRASGYLFTWIFVVVIAVGVLAPGDGCFTDWDGRSNPTFCP